MHMSYNIQVTAKVLSYSQQQSDCGVSWVEVGGRGVTWEGGKAVGGEGCPMLQGSLSALAWQVRETNQPGMKGEREGRGRRE